MANLAGAFVFSHWRVSRRVLGERKRACNLLRRACEHSKRSCGLRKRACELCKRACALLARACALRKRACQLLKRAFASRKRACKLFIRACALHKRACKLRKRRSQTRAASRVAHSAAFHRRFYSTRRRQREGRGFIALAIESANASSGGNEASTSHRDVHQILMHIFRFSLSPFARPLKQINDAAHAWTNPLGYDRGRARRRRVSRTNSSSPREQRVTSARASDGLPVRFAGAIAPPASPAARGGRSPASPRPPAPRRGR